MFGGKHEEFYAVNNYLQNCNCKFEKISSEPIGNWRMVKFLMLLLIITMTKNPRKY